MKTQINRLINAYAVHLDDRKHLAPLADFIEQNPLFVVLEIRWDIQAEQGTIIVNCYEIKNWIDVIRELSGVVENYKKDNL